MYLPYVRLFGKADTSLYAMASEGKQTQPRTLKPFDFLNGFGFYYITNSAD